MFNSLKTALFCWLQYALPQHFLSDIMHKLTRSEIRWWKDLAITRVVAHYGVNLNEAKREKPADYKSFNDFFTRELKPAARPVQHDDNLLLSPADGAISEIGSIDGDRILQAKNRDFSVQDLLGGDADLARSFAGGEFVTIYLSPRDYHRLHMPCSGSLSEMTHVPGRLFSVNQATASFVPNLFARNERVITVFSTPFGKMALILVGAIFVSSIETVWHGAVNTEKRASPRQWSYRDQSTDLAQGQEMGRFNMGSTIIVLTEPETVGWYKHLQAGSPVKVGEAIGSRAASTEVKD